jgi:uroporphyrinogen-III decarboxylase
MLKIPTNAEKKAVWDAYWARKPTRVPLCWGIGPRYTLLTPELNPEKFTFEQFFTEPRVTLTVLARFQEFLGLTANKYCDNNLVQLPETWDFFADNQNVYDPAYFGAPVKFPPNQVPQTFEVFDIAEVEDFLKRDFSKPLENPWIKSRLAFHEKLVKEAERFEYLGRKGKVQPFGVGFDGPLTCAVGLFGAGALTLLAEDPELAKRLMLKITRDALIRNRALGDLAGGWKKADAGGMADDSVMMISTASYRRCVMPAHAFWYDETSNTTPASRKRHIHLCGDSTRHFKTIRDELGVNSFDTGFPVDHGALRRQLGPEIDIYGGPPVAIFQNGSPADCAKAAKAVLQSGVMEGGRFILREGNNLPPGVAMEKLAAVYEVCMEYGKYR